MGCGASTAKGPRVSDEFTAPIKQATPPVHAAETGSPSGSSPANRVVFKVSPPDDPLGAAVSSAADEVPTKKKGSGRRFEMQRANTTAIDRRSAPDESPKSSDPLGNSADSSAPLPTPKKHRPRAASFDGGSGLNGVDLLGRSTLAAAPDKGGSFTSPRGGTSSTVTPPQRHRARAMSTYEHSKTKPIVRYTDYVTAEDGKTDSGPSRKHARMVVASAETEVELKQRMLELQASAARLSASEAEMVLGVLRKHFLTARFSPSQLMQLVKSCEREETEEGKTVVAQGETDAEHFYIINDGEYQVEVTKKDGEAPVMVAKLASGAFFGEMALLSNTTRTATIRCLEDGSVFRIARAAYLFAIREDVPESDMTSPASTSTNASPSMNRPTGGKQKGAVAQVEESPPWFLSLLPAGEEKAKQKALLKTLQEVALEAGETTFGASSPIGPAIVLVLDGEIQITGDPTKATRDDGLWRVSAFGDLATDATMRTGDVFAVGGPGDEGRLALLYAHWLERETETLRARAAVALGHGRMLL